MFPPTLAAAQERIAWIDPTAYARSRNALDGAVTRLSPYLTHGFLDLPELIGQLNARQPLAADHKLVMELGWREFFAHVWRHQGEHIFQNFRSPVSEQPYEESLPVDVLEACSGVPAIDQAVIELYDTGYLHNHARLWLASYLVHFRKRHWRSAADWLYGHLLDGDLASNHLSWQWVAGTFSVKPYLFNAENVARYAPPAWHSPGTVLDQSYGDLDLLARQQPDVGPEPRRPAPRDPPALWSAPPGIVSQLPDRLPERLRLVHPWDLGAAADEQFRLGVIHRPFHRRFPWSARRWDFVLSRLQESTDALFVGDLSALAPQLRGREVTAKETLNPGYGAALRAVATQWPPIPRFLPEPERPCRSFSQFYSLASRDWHRPAR